jgi:hypothetical protein
MVNIFYQTFMFASLLGSSRDSEKLFLRGWIHRNTKSNGYISQSTWPRGELMYFSISPFNMQHEKAFGSVNLFSLTVSVSFAAS